MSDRNETIKAIRKALKLRSGKLWSVKGGHGTAWGWITVDAPPARQTWEHYLPEGSPDEPESYRTRDTGQPGGCTSPNDRAELGALMGLESVHLPVSIPASNDYYREHIDRAEGRTPTVEGRPYWD
jgi:hypothetical protein